MSRPLTQADRNQTSAATFAEDIRPSLIARVNPQTGSLRGPLKTIQKPKTYRVYDEPEDFPRKYFVSDPEKYQAAAHRAPRFRFTKDGRPLTRYFKSKTNSSGGKKNQKSHKNSHKKSHKKRTHRRRH